MGFAPFSKALVISVGPRAGVPATVRPQIKGGPECFIAVPPKVDLMEGTGLVADGRGAGVTLQRLRGVKPMAILPQFAQQPRRDFGASSRQRAEQLVVGVLGKQLFDLLAVILQLRLQYPQLFGTRHGQATLGLAKGV